MTWSPHMLSSMQLSAAEMKAEQDRIMKEQEALMLAKYGEELA